MSLDRVTLHQKYIDTILALDLEPMMLNQEKLRLMPKLADELAELKVMIDRMPFFEKILDESFREGEITEVEKNGITKYIQQWSKEYSLHSNSQGLFNCESQLFGRNKKRFNLPNKTSLWEKLIEVSKSIDRIEDDLTVKVDKKRDEYIKLQAEFNKLLVTRDQTQKQDETNKEILNKTFGAENISTVEDIQALCRKDVKKTELLLVSHYSDPDLASVIQMRAKKCRDKGNELIIMTSDQFLEIMNTNQLIHGISKISFLHHRRDETYYYKDTISNIINNLPDLTEIVLRGCGTAKKPGKEFESVYNVKKVNEPYDKSPSIQGGTQLVIQQKENNEGNILTKVSWMTQEPGSQSYVRHEITDIVSVSKMTGKKPTNDQIKELTCIQGMPLLKHADHYISPLRKTFFDRNAKMSSEDIHNTKKVLRRARTETVPSSQDDLLSEIVSNMTPAQRSKVSVKAYVAGYNVHQNRVLPDHMHGHDTSPKAVRVGPKRKS